MGRGGGAEGRRGDLSATPSAARDGSLRRGARARGHPDRQHHDAAARLLTPDDRADGDQTAVIEWPKKLIWYQNYPPQLFDLERDPGETVDLSSREPAVVDSLLATVRAAESGQLRDLEAVPVGIERERAERLRALGYLVR